MSGIPVGSKYAMLALPARYMRLRISDPVDLGNLAYVTGGLPFPLPDHWRDWLGSLRADALNAADLFLVTHAPSKAPWGLDRENQILENQLRLLYFGILVAAPHFGHDEGMLLTGTRDDSQVDVRGATHFDPVLSPPGSHGVPLDDSLLRLGEKISRAAESLQGAGEHSRVWRITHAFSDALHSDRLGARLHQCVRCIEGFVYPDIGQTKKQMRSRTRLLIGRGHETLVDTLFDLRSAVEHLHGPYSLMAGTDRRAQDLELAELCYKSQAIARLCILRLFTTPRLWTHFANDSSLKAFWSLKQDAREALWGETLDVGAAFGHFSRQAAEFRIERDSN